MSVKIVTNSTADLSPKFTNEFGITMVTVYVRFGQKIYREMYMTPLPFSAIKKNRKIKWKQLNRNPGKNIR